jgi:hypothetical protein
MGYKTTRSIDRGMAIKRILQMDALIQDKDYREIESETHENAEYLAELVNSATPLAANETSLNKWTNTMLSEQMDRPLYRFSLLENYLVE